MLSREPLFNSFRPLLIVSFCVIFAPVVCHGQIVRPYAQCYLLECTKGEYVAAGSDDNVLRWGRTDGNDQKWTFIPAAGGKYHLQSAKNGKHLNIQGITGNASLYKRRFNDAEQVFSIEPVSDTEAMKLVDPEIYRPFTDLADYRKTQGLTPPYQFVRIVESTRDERLAVGSNGNVLRWPSVNDRTQLFIAVSVVQMSALENNLVRRSARAADFADTAFDKGVGTSRSRIDLKSLTTYMTERGVRLGSVLIGSESDWKGTVFRNFTTDDLNFFILSDKTNVYVSFVGTKTQGNWVVNGAGGAFSSINVQPVFNASRFQGIPVHLGWSLATNEIYDTVVAELELHGVTSKNVYLTGHSLGGALAGHTAYLLMKNGVLPAGRPHQLVTFGAPRYASALFRANFSAQQKRYPLFKAYSLEIDEDYVINSWRDYLITAAALTGGVTGTIASIPEALDVRARRSLSEIANADDSDAHSLSNYVKWVE